MLRASTCVGDAVTLSGPASIGAQVVLHDGASVADSVLWDGCRIRPGARVTGSVLASGCVVGAGARVRDSELDEGVHVLPDATVGSASVNPGEK